VGVWIVTTISGVCLFGYVLFYGTNPDIQNLMGDVGAIWGVTSAFVIRPAWRAMKQWPASRRKFVLSSGIAVAIVIGLLFWMRVRQMAKLQALFDQDHEF
jgi:hypothetical protein